MVDPIESKKLGTIELSTGLQISGVFTEVIQSEKRMGEVAYFQTNGPTALADRNHEIIGHSQLDHPHGYGSPIGKLKGINLAIEDMSPRDLQAYEIHEGGNIKLEFESGVIIDGQVITGKRNIMGKIQVISFKNCTVRYQDRILFEPSEGIYHMAVGRHVVSAYAGPADYLSFDLVTHQISEDPPISVDSDPVNKLFEELDILSQGHPNHINFQRFINKAKETAPGMWLLYLELNRLLLSHNMMDLSNQIQSHLSQIANEKPNVAHLIEDGLGA